MKHPCRCTHVDEAHADATGSCRYCHCEAFQDATTEHTARLRDLAVHALQEAKRDLTRTGRVNPFFVFTQADGEKLRLDIPEQAAGIMNHGEAKDLLFATVRTIVHDENVQAVVFASDGWYGKSTQKALTMPREEFLAKTRERAFQAAVDEGLVDRCEAILISVQTPARAMIIHQLYERDDNERQITYLELTVMEMDVNEFGGRQKMYGDLREENLR